MRTCPRDDPEEYIERSRRAFIDRVRRENDRDIERSLDARIKRSFERQTERQIMVDNLRVFRREYINMVIRRSC